VASAGWRGGASSPASPAGIGWVPGRHASGQHARADPRMDDAARPLHPYASGRIPQVLGRQPACAAGPDWSP